MHQSILIYTDCYKQERLMVLSRNTVNGARRKRPTLGGVTLYSLTCTVVALLTVHAQAFHCGNYINRPRKISQFRVCSADDKAMMLRHTINPRINVFCQICRRNTQLLHVLGMSTKDDNIAVQQTNLNPAKSANETASLVDSSSKRIISRSSLSRTLVLAVPLLLKFVLVLMIKFLTDLVVFPLLFTYRGTRIMKRRIFKIWDRWTSPPTTTSDDSTEGSTLNLENYIANGSSPSSEISSS